MIGSSGKGMESRAGFNTIVAKFSMIHLIPHSFTKHSQCRFAVLLHAALLACYITERLGLDTFGASKHLYMCAVGHVDGEIIKGETDEQVKKRTPWTPALPSTSIEQIILTTDGSLSSLRHCCWATHEPQTQFDISCLCVFVLFTFTLLHLLFIYLLFILLFTFGIFIYLFVLHTNLLYLHVQIKDLCCRCSRLIMMQRS